MEIRYEKLTHENFGGHSLDDFIRHQEIHECWRNVNGDIKLVPNEFSEDWSIENAARLPQEFLLGWKRTCRHSPHSAENALWDL